MTVTTGADVVTAERAEDVTAIMRDAIYRREPLQITGAGTWRNAGPPVAAARTLSLSGLSGIMAYVPGDLTITAWAGTSLAELAHATAAHGQWLGLDPAGSRDGTLGATLATASSGPLSHAFGTPRDLVLGLHAVTGYGDAVSPGGRVVKNVAGFDLVRLFIGSWGTLGAITAATLRLRALPVHDITLAIDAPEAAELTALIASLRANTLSLLACEWLDGDTARTLGAGTGADTILVRIGGSDAFVRGQRAVLEGVAPVRACDPVVWSRLAACDHDAAAVVRFGGPVSTVADRIARLRRSLRHADGVTMHAGIARGIVRVIASGESGAVRDALQVRHADDSRVVERLPQAWWRTEPDPFAEGLAARIRAAFDPHQLCNRRTTHA